MATEQEARQAEEQYATMLENLKPVLGVGVVPLDSEANSGFAVAVYVKTDNSSAEITGAKKSRIPSSLEIQSNGKPTSVPTKILPFSAPVLQ